jgi:hypothetical protein
MATASFEGNFYSDSFTEEIRSMIRTIRSKLPIGRFTPKEQYSLGNDILNYLEHLTVTPNYAFKSLNSIKDLTIVLGVYNILQNEMLALISDTKKTLFSLLINKYDIQEIMNEYLLLIQQGTSELIISLSKLV